MPRYNWFRMYHEARNDRKLNLLSNEQFRVWFNLMCCASEAEERGVIVVDDYDLLAIEVAGGSAELLMDTLTQLKRLKIIDGADGVVQFINWDRRQYDKPSDKPEAVRERVTRHRSKKSNAQNNIVNAGKRDVTPCNAHRIGEDRIGEDRIGVTGPDTKSEKDLATPAGKPPPASPRLPQELPTVLVSEDGTSLRGPNVADVWRWCHDRGEDLFPLSITWKALEPLEIALREYREFMTGIDLPTWMHDLFVTGKSAIKYGNARHKFSIIREALGYEIQFLRRQQAGKGGKADPVPSDNLPAVTFPGYGVPQFDTPLSAEALEAQAELERLLAEEAATGGAHV